MEIDNHEEGGGTRGMHVSQHPAVFNIAHDVFNRGECSLPCGDVVHCQPDASQQLVDQHDKREDAEVVPNIRFFGA